MNNANGSVFKYPDNVDTDVIIPARYLNTQNAKELGVQVAGRDDDIGIHVIRVFENRTVCVVHG